MPTKRVLLAWSGHSDFRALATESPPALQQEIMARVKGELPAAGEWGPIRTLLEHETFDQTVLLSTYPLALTQRYTGWLNRSVQTVFVNLPAPTDYPAIFQPPRRNCARSASGPTPGKLRSACTSAPVHRP